MQRKRALRQPLSYQSFNIRSFVTELQNQWLAHEKMSRQTNIALAILQGIAERTTGRGTNSKDGRFFTEQFELVKANNADPLHIENAARDLELPVCNPHEHATAIEGWFAYVGNVTNKAARVIMLDNGDVHILDDLRIPVVLLPADYRSEGSGVVWVEREYPSGPKGRFEPASTKE